MNTKATIQLKLTPELKERLKRHCQRIGGKYTPVITIAIEEYLDRVEGGEK